ncbi:MAG: histidine kinase [Mucilaginibacter polytrichastri]|nr:histidine kinase [Mucilaginibacter polytrichastri]
MTAPLQNTTRGVVLLVIWWIVWASIQEFVLISMGISIELATIDSIVSTIILGIACTQISNSMRFYRPQKTRYFYLIFWCLFLALAATGMTQYILDYFYPPREREFLHDSFLLRALIAFLVIGMMILIGVLWYTLEDQKENEQRKADAERLAREAELFNLRQQLQPHFLFNSLNSINALIGFNPEEARRMIFQLSDFLRGTLHKDDTGNVTLQAELEHLQLYLDIEKVRFGHRLHTEISCDDKSREAKLPPMLLQPVIENAIKFGLYDTTQQVNIRLNARLENSMLVLAVQNPYDPETASPRKGTGFGLHGIRRRLYLLFARQDLLESTGRDRIYTTTLKIPQA